MKDKRKGKKMKDEKTTVQKFDVKIVDSLLDVLAKTVVQLCNPELNLAYNRLELQIKQLRDSGEACDFTYFLQLCNSFEDELRKMTRDREMQKYLTPEVMAKIMPPGGFPPVPGAPEPGVNEQGKKKIGFHAD